MEEEKKMPKWAERLINRLDELDRKLAEKKEEKPLFAGEKERREPTEIKNPSLLSIITLLDINNIYM